MSSNLFLATFPFLPEVHEAEDLIKWTLESDVLVLIPGFLVSSSETQDPSFLWTASTSGHILVLMLLRVPGFFES